MVQERWRAVATPGAARALPTVDVDVCTVTRAVRDRHGIGVRQRREIRQYVKRDGRGGVNDNGAEGNTE